MAPDDPDENEPPEDEPEPHGSPPRDPREPAPMMTLVTFLSGASVWVRIGPHADLAGAILRDISLRGVDLTGAHLQNADLAGTDLTRANLTAADLTGARLDDTTLFRVVWNDLTRWGEVEVEIRRGSQRVSPGKGRHGWYRYVRVQIIEDRNREDDEGPEPHEAAGYWNFVEKGGEGWDDAAEPTTSESWDDDR